MSEIQQMEPQVKNYRLTDLAQDMANEDPDIFGPDGRFPMFDEKKRDGELEKVINKANFMRWVRKSMHGTYEEERSVSKKSTLSKITSIFRRKPVEPSSSDHSEIADFDFDAFSKKIEDMKKERKEVTKQDILLVMGAQHWQEKYDLAA